MTTGCYRFTICLLIALLPATCVAQFEIPQSQLDYTKSELDKYRGKLAKAISGIDYKDPGKESGWQQSLAAWESMDFRPGYPSEEIAKGLGIDSAKRTPQQQQAIQNFYLCYAHQPTVLQLRTLSERVDWLNAHFWSGKSGLNDGFRHHWLKMFWLRRLVDTYRATTDDKPKLQKRVVAFLDRAANNLAERGQFDNLTARQCRECIEAGCNDPVFLAISNLTYVITSSNHKKLFGQAWKRLPDVVTQLADAKYPRLIEMMARKGQCKLVLDKFKQLDLDANVHDDIESAYHTSIVAALQEESVCPENLEALTGMLRFIKSQFRKQRHQMNLYTTLSSSELPTGVKELALQLAGRRLDQGAGPDGEIKAMFVHGERAAKELPLMIDVVKQLVDDGHASGDLARVVKWYKQGRQRAPRHYFLYRNVHHTLSSWGDPESHQEFFTEILNSEDYKSGVPWVAYRLLGHYIPRSWSTRQKESNKIILALEEKLKLAPSHGQSPEWCKSNKQLLVYLMMKYGMFSDALRVGSELNGDFGKYEFKGQKITTARIAKLNDSFTYGIQKEIDDGSFDPQKAQETINKLALIRMDMDPETGLYIDEMVDTLQAIDDFNAGNWANLTTSAEYLSGWKAQRDIEKWKPVENGLSTSDTNSSVVRQLYWRWLLNKPYIVEAEIEVVPNKGMKAKRGAKAGLAITRGAKWANAIPKYKFLINPPLKKAGLYGYRDKQCPVKDAINETGPNRIRMRVWKDYFEVVLNGQLVGRYVIPTVFPNDVMLIKSYGVAQVFYRNVRIRKLESQSPVGENLFSVDYWHKRLEFEPNSDDVKNSLKIASQRNDPNLQLKEAEGKNESPIERKPLEITEGLVAMWTFDKDTREAFSDELAVEQLKTQIVPGKVGGGLQLSDSATSNRISVEGIDLCDLDGPWTISFWINSARDDGALFSQGGGELGTFEAELSDNNLDLCLLTKRQRSVFSCKKKTPLGEWQHIAVTCDGSGDREGVSIFVDGKEEEIYRAASNNRAHRAADSPEPRFEFGSTYNPRFGYTAAATIDEVRCYNLQLTPYDIDKIMRYQSR